MVIAINQRNTGLDVLRAAAILMVVLRHSLIILQPVRELGTATENIFLVLQTGGVFGVELFFVLSGFLIGSILIKLYNDNGGLSFSALKEFWVRRWFRTLPNYFLVLTVIVLINHFFSFNGCSGRDFLAYYFFSQNLFSPHSENCFGEAWSLSVEEWFYILFPLGLFLLTKIFSGFKKPGGFLKYLLVFFVVFLLLRIIAFVSFEYLGFYAVRTIVSLRLDAIAWGVLWAYVSIQRPDLFHKKRVAFLTLGSALLAFCLIYVVMDLKGIQGWWYVPAFHSIFLFSVISAGFGFLLPAFYSIKQLPARIGRMVEHISKTSYSLYLIHLSLVFYFFEEWLIRPSIPAALLAFGAYWVGCLLFASLLYKYYELPMMNLRDKVMSTGGERSEP
ncbi:MAG: acyltransferase [Gemmatimonadaceae bacterium]|nr:acyltransferase [Chitinophagaceae bacterium]